MNSNTTYIDKYQPPSRSQLLSPTNKVNCKDPKLWPQDSWVLDFDGPLMHDHESSPMPDSKGIPTSDPWCQTTSSPRGLCGSYLHGRPQILSHPLTYPTERVTHWPDFLSIPLRSPSGYTCECFHFRFPKASFGTGLRRPMRDWNSSTQPGQLDFRLLLRG